MLTEAEKTSARHHLGYSEIGGAQTFVLGIPAAVQTAFMIEGAMNLILPSAEPEFRRHLAILDGIETQNVQDLELLAVLQVDEIRINPDELKVLFGQEYMKWRASLANLLGIVANPFDQRFLAAGGSGINVRMG